MPHGSADPWRPSATLARLRAGLATLGAGEQRVARAVLAEAAAVVELSTTELAAASGTSQATVVRACHRLGFRGFQHLRLELGPCDTGTRDRGGHPGGHGVRGRHRGAHRDARDHRFRRVRRRRGPAGPSDSTGGYGFSSPPIQDAALRFTTVGRSVEAPLGILGQQFSARISQLSQNFSRTRTYCPALCPGGVTMSVTLRARRERRRRVLPRDRIAVCGPNPAGCQRPRRADDPPSPALPGPDGGRRAATGAAALAGSPR